MIHWKVTLTPLVGLVEVGTVDPEDLGRSYDRATGAMVPSPNAELVADRVINLPIQKRADEEVYKFFHGANLFNYQPIMAHTQCSYHLDTVVGATGHPQVILIAAHKRAWCTEFAAVPGVYELGTTYYQIPPWTLVFAAGYLHHRNPPAVCDLVSHIDPLRRRVRYSWHVQPSTLLKKFGLVPADVGLTANEV
jgi:hypothetical protein